MSYQVKITRSAEKELDRLPQKVASRIEQELRFLGGNPRPPQTRRLEDSPYYRFRMGDYRILYLVDDQKREIVIERIAHRRDVYR